MTSNCTKLRALWLVLCTTAGAAACGNNITDSATQHTRIVLDVRSLVGELAAANDFVSVLASANLTISSPDQQLTLTRQLGDNDSEATFDVAVQPGTVRFRVDVVSNNQTVVYQGDTTATIERDGFTVVVRLAATNAVMVISPRSPHADTVPGTGGNLDTLELLVRNAGSTPMRWLVDAAQNALFCVPRSQPQASCFGPDSLTLAAGGRDTAVMEFEIPVASLPTSRTLAFGSTVGRATVVVTIP